MKNWTYKGDGLSHAITAAGHFRYFEDDREVVSDAEVVQRIHDEYPLSSFQEEVCARISEYAFTLRSKTVSGVSPLEMSSWSLKRSEALDGKTDGLLAKEAVARGITLQDLSVKVLDNSAALEDREALIAGVAGKHKDALRLLKDFDAVAAYDWRTGWPDV